MSEPDEKSKIGAFGRAQPIGFFGIKFLRWEKFALLFLFGILLALVSMLSVASFGGWIDWVPPRIEAVKLPSGVGSGAVTLSFELEDDGLGLRQILVEGEQGLGIQRFFQKVYPPKINKDLINISFSRAEHSLQEGRLILKITAVDNSIFSNTRQLSFEIPVDEKLPEIKLLSNWPTLSLGESGIVFYTVEDNDRLLLSGVKVDSYVFPGFPANRLDSAFNDFSNLYFALFAAPYDADLSGKMELFAADRSQNTVTISVAAQILSAPFTNPLIKEERVESNLRELLSRPPPIRYWEDRLTCTFGDGAADAKVNRALFAVASGVVIFSDELDVYGKSVIVDHGLGLSSLYTGLSSITKQEGDRVEGGDPLGLRGEIGSPAENSIRFELRLNGILVNSVYWCNSEWMEQRLMQPIKEVKKQLGNKETEFLD